MLRAESAGDVHAISSAGAWGLMQVMPDTWAGLRARYRLGRDPYDPHDNIMAGTAYLREMWDRYGDVGAMLAAYNAGPGRVKSWLPGSGCVPADIWVELIPFMETEGYVRRALFYAAIYEHRMGESMTPLSSRLADLTRAGATGNC